MIRGGEAARQGCSAEGGGAKRQPNGAISRCRRTMRSQGQDAIERGVDGGGEAAESAYQDERKGTTSPQGPTQLVRLDMFTLISIGI